MKLIKRGLDNQGIGLLPLLLFMFLDNYFSYLLSFAISFGLCLISILLYHLLSKGRVYQYMLLPSVITLLLYSLFLSFRIESVLYLYSPVITEILFVIVITFFIFPRGIVFRKIRLSDKTVSQRMLLRSTVNEFYFVSKMVRTVFTFHLLGVLLFNLFPNEQMNPTVQHFLYRELGYLLGIVVILYEQIRLMLMRGTLRKEMWLPVLSDKGKVIGCIARSVSRSVPKKYYHPIVRIVVVYNGMLYLKKRGSDRYVSPDTYDYPYHCYMLYNHTLENTISEMIAQEGEQAESPHFLIRYTYEDDKVKHLIFLYALCLHSEEQLQLYKQEDGKLWTVKQIKENLGKDVFSVYFEEEFPYLQSTILLAESIMHGEEEENKLNDVLTQ